EIAEKHDGDLEVVPSCWQRIEKYGLAPFFWQQIEKSFGYRREDPDLQNLLFHLLLSEFSHLLREHTPKEFEAYKLNDSGTGNAGVCLAQWRDSAKQAASYNILSENVSVKISLKDKIKPLTPETLVRSTTFREADSVIVTTLLKRLNATDQSTDVSAIEDIATQRQASHWMQSTSVSEPKRRARRAVYEAIISAARFFELRNKYQDGFQNDSVESLYQAYVDELYQFDQLYRHYHYSKDLFQKEEAQQIFGELTERIENAYKTAYLQKLALSWAPYMPDLLSNWSVGIDGVENQHQFFKQKVAKYHKDQSRKVRTYVIISDAFRYEAGVELTKELNGTDKASATISTQLGVLPSYTTLGMASLLPHDTLTYSGTSVLADGKSTAGTDGRKAILETVNGTAIRSEDLLNLKKQEGREFQKDKEVVYIYHNEIDAKGDSATTESETFAATRTAIDELRQLVKYIFNNLSGTRVLITADHGYLYTVSSPDETDKSKLPDKPISTVLAKKRYLIGEDLPEHDLVWRGQTSRTAGCDGQTEFWIPKAANRFHFTGGARFIHGGAMPQEIIIPVIEVKQAKSDADIAKTKTKTVDVSLLGSNHKITTPTHRFKFVQTEPVGDRHKILTAKIAIYDGDTVVSNIATIVFDSESPDLDDRIQTVKLTLTDRQFDRQRAYQLIVKDSSTDFPVTSQDVYIDRAISDDFDF
ncbi:MAG: BREX-1 system phosphatase PglZ type A, partial [SAR202 cluster bacterium]|nr:BREX-1 system phosphatase PglZ type A [SAR202 cluster bacterium]